MLQRLVNSPCKRWISRIGHLRTSLTEKAPTHHWPHIDQPLPNFQKCRLDCRMKCITLQITTFIATHRAPFRTLTVTKDSTQKLRKTRGPKRRSTTVIQAVTKQTLDRVRTKYKQRFQHPFWYDLDPCRGFPPSVTNITHALQRSTDIWLREGGRCSSLRN